MRDQNIDRGEKAILGMGNSMLKVKEEKKRSRKKEQSPFHLQWKEDVKLRLGQEYGPSQRAWPFFL